MADFIECDQVEKNKRVFVVEDSEDLTVKKKKQQTLTSFFTGGSTKQPLRHSRELKLKKKTIEKRTVTVDTVEKSWKECILAEYNANDWLQYDIDGKHAKNLRCKVCSNYLTLIEGMKHFRIEWITGSTNYRPSNAIDHATADPHKKAMKAYYSDQGKIVVDKRSKGQQSIQQGLATQTKNNIRLTKKKFQTAYFIAKEELPLSKFNPILQLEELHDVEIGDAYRHSNACGELIDAIGDELADDLRRQLESVNFCSVLWDGTTDISVSEKEIIICAILV